MGDEMYVEIQGLRAFRKSLRETAKAAPEAMKVANGEAVDTIIRAAKVNAEGQSHRTAQKAAGSLRATRSASYAAVLAGGGRYPFFYGAEFGSKRYKRFQSWRGNQWAGWSGGPGYFLHPAIRDKGPEVVAKFMERFEEVTSKAFPE